MNIKWIFSKVCAVVLSLWCDIYSGITKHRCYHPKMEMGAHIMIYWHHLLVLVADRTQPLVSRHHVILATVLADSNIAAPGHSKHQDRSEYILIWSSPADSSPVDDSAQLCLAPATAPGRVWCPGAASLWGSCRHLGHPLPPQGCQLRS